jgi:hypothetical protein
MPTAASEALEQRYAVSLPPDLTGGWHLALDCPNKFSVQRLLALKKREIEPRPPLPDMYVAALEATGAWQGDTLERIRSYWVGRARAAQARGAYAEAYEMWFRAGWDAFFTNDIDQVLEGLVGAAHHAGLTALHRLALVHRGAAHT